MRIAKTLPEFLEIRSSLKSKNISFVPTMGNLHKGHLNLMNLAKKNSEILISSIFVNPAQFSPNEDFDKYPRTFEKDVEKLNSQGVDLLFAPLSTKELYPQGYLTRVYMSSQQGATNPLRNNEKQTNWLEEQPEGIKRPGFFDGIATVLTKLFNIIRPNVVVFGQKDAIQCIVVKQLVRDLNFADIKVIIGRTEREIDGLAMSSRNQYLNILERKNFGSILYSSLTASEKYYKENTSSTIKKNFNQDSARNLVENCYHSLEEKFKKALEIVNPNDKSRFAVEYVTLCDNETGKVFGSFYGEEKTGGLYKEGEMEIGKSRNEMNLSIVVRVNGTRLLDNIVLSRE